MSFTLAVIDQHAADERYRLERLIEQLRHTKHVRDPVMNIPMSERHLRSLWKRRDALLQWGIEIAIEKFGVVRESEVPKTVEMDNAERQGITNGTGMFLLKGAPEITKDLDTGKWKQILLQYVSEEATQLPSLLTEFLASKACRSVPPQRPQVKQNPTHGRR